MSSGHNFGFRLMPVAAVAGEGAVGDVFQQIARRDVELTAEDSEKLVVNTLGLSIRPSPQSFVANAGLFGERGYGDSLSPVLVLSNDLVEPWLYCHVVPSQEFTCVDHIIPLDAHSVNAQTLKFGHPVGYPLDKVVTQWYNKVGQWEK